MKKKVVLLLLVVLAMALTGCELVEKNMDVDNGLVILSYNGKEITKKEVVDAANSQLNQIAQMYGNSYNIADPQNISDAQKSVIENQFKPQLVIDEKILEYGFDSFTEEELVEIEKNAEESYASQKEFLKEYFLKDTTLLDEELEETLENMANEMGGSIENLIEYEKKNFSQNKLKEKMVEGITISDEEIEKAFEEKVATDKDTYENNLSAFANAVNGGKETYFTPEGIRYTKHILREFPEENKKEIDDLTKEKSTLESSLSSLNTTLASLETSEEKNVKEEKTATTKEIENIETAIKELDIKLESAKETGYKALDKSVNEIIEKLENDNDFDGVMEEFGQDPGMKNEPQKSTGYAIYQDFSSFDPAFVEAGMALKAIGDISGPVKGLHGIHVIEYTADGESGPASLQEDMRKILSEELLLTKQNEHFNAQVSAWVEAATFTENLNNLNR